MRDLRGDLGVRFFGADLAPLSSEELAIATRMNGLCSVDELTNVRGLVCELLWFGAATLEEIIDVDEIDILDECDDDATAFALCVRRATPQHCKA